MVFEKLLKCLLLITAVLLPPAQAFWWASPTAAPTTESPRVLKEIPLTYFRSYTYQPIAGNPFAAFPYYHRAASALPSPLLAGPARYEHGTYLHASAYPVSVAVPHPQQQQQSMLPQMYPLPQAAVLHAKPLPSSTTTTSTTSTEPPTTTSTTTTTKMTTTTPPPPSTTTASSSTSTTSASIAQLSESQQQPQTQPQPYPYPYPTYNRRAYMGYNPHSYRPAYPYPDYTVYKTAPATRYNSQGGQIQFVPCMCPVSVGASGPLQHSAMSVEGRTTSDEEDDLMMLARADELNLPVELSVVTERAAQETTESVKPQSDTEVTENLASKTSEAAVEQLSTNKVDEQSHYVVELGSTREQNGA
ncbi:PREDICTED: cell wall protein DAN4 isoform X2 [Bactrocera latifrons]|uniref:cell wall protein DAN4 isoform X2 n=1 Tax=Bactrocera latifrons TaxID=174628 RepID=UPI0008DE6A61|nr:PREDICTED: cell wall protein DAN4 isoform X2 [Bactrocera latifrons]